MPCFVATAYAGSYRNYDVFISAFKALAKTYPEYVTTETIGRTVHGRNIIMFRIGNQSGGRVLFDGAMHGAENLGAELLYLYAKWLLSSADPLARHILSKTCTLMIPALNADGYNSVRQNANGVDLNRNFATDWEQAPGDDPDSDVYRGPAPLSEPEARTLLRTLQTSNPSFYVNLHRGAGSSYGGSRYGDASYDRLLAGKISVLSTQRGVASYYYSGQFSGPGFAISDAARAGVTSFLIELTTEDPLLSEVEILFLPKFIPIAAILSQECENVRAFPRWDLNQDGKVDMVDVGIANRTYASTPELANWDPRADVNMDNRIDIIDVAIVSGHFGEIFS